MPFSSAVLACVLASNPGNSIDYRTTPTVYLVGYSHLDTQWNWTYRHTIQDCLPKTLNDNFALFDKYPDYVFNWTGAKRYALIKEYYPELFERLKKYVAQRRWVVTGSGWDECDADVPTPESIIRQVLYSNRFFKKEFGVTSNNYLVPDIFGFPASLPSSLAHAGVKGISTCKLSYYPDTSSPIPFNVGRWVGPDGASVIGALNSLSYHTPIEEDVSSSPTIQARIADEKAKSGLQLDYTYYGTGDEGGAPEEKSVQWLEKSLHGPGPIHVISKAADQMYDDLTPAQIAKLPEYKGELLISKHTAGTSTTGSTMKRWNQRNELLVDAAERAATSARLLSGAPYPQDRLTDAWTRFLGGQMHDILPGTCMPQAYAFAWNDQIVALNESADVVQSAVAQVARKMDTRAKGVAVLVYNPLSCPRTDLVEADVPLSSPGVKVVGPDGKTVPSQKNGDHVTFQATVPSIGFATFDVRPDNGAPSTELSITKERLENARYRVRIDLNGDVSSIFDKKANRELLSGPARLAFLHQKPEKHPAWDMDWADQQKEPEGYVDGPAQISVLENGPARVALRIERTSRGSRFVTIVRLGKGGEDVEFNETIDWRSVACCLKASFPLAVTNPKATYDCGIGTVQRGNDWKNLYEGPSQRWLDLTDQKGDYGVSILSEARFGSDKPDDNTLRLTLLYTPGVGNSYQYQGTNDWGRHEIRFAITGHAGSWQDGQEPERANRFVQPLMAFGVSTHPGELGKSISVAQISDPGVAMMAMKKAEDSGETVIRLLEREGKPAKNVRLKFDRPVLSARCVDGQENPIEAPVRVENGVVVLDLGAYAPRAIALKFAQPERKELSEPIALPFNAHGTSDQKGDKTGDLDGQGRTLPGDLLPDVIDSGGVRFQVGPRSGANVVRCDGQKLSVQGGKRIYLLAASADGDRTASFSVDGKSENLKIQAWDGFVGEWDTRQWEGIKPDDQSVWGAHRVLGIEPGYVKRDPIAWYADHRRLSDGTDDAYRFAYLFRYAIDLPTGANAITLPNDSKIVILAATLKGESNADARPLHPLYDTLEGHVAWTAP